MILKKLLLKKYLRKLSWQNGMEIFQLKKYFLTKGKDKPDI